MSSHFHKSIDLFLGFVMITVSRKREEVKMKTYTFPENFWWGSAASDRKQKEE